MAEIVLPGACREIVAEIAGVAGYLWERGWAECNGGNITVDVTDFMPRGLSRRQKFPRVSLPISQAELAGRSFLVKVGGACMRDLAQQPKRHLLLITITDDLAGYDILWGGEGSAEPTSEFISHLKIHQHLRRHQMPQRVFLHTHPDHLIALSHLKDYCQEEALNRLLFAMYPEVRIFLPEGIGVAPYRCPGSEALADVTLEALKDHRVVLWEKHGCAAIAEGVPEAFDLVDIVDKAARLFFICKGAHYEPQGLSREQLGEIDRKFHRR
jgi:rhamnulose-1-phosphate aldolase